MANNHGVSALNATAGSVRYIAHRWSGTRLEILGEQGWVVGPDLSGPSAYDLWRAAGNTGSQAEYQESLKGAAGPDVNMRVHDGAIEWRRDGGVWAELISITGLLELTGAAALIEGVLPAAEQVASDRVVVQEAAAAVALSVEAIEGAAGALAGAVASAEQVALDRVAVAASAEQVELDRQAVVLAADQTAEDRAATEAARAEVVGALAGLITPETIGGYLQSYQQTAEKGLPSGYAGLDQDGRVPAEHLPISSEEQALAGEDNESMMTPLRVREAALSAIGHQEFTESGVWTPPPHMSWVFVEVWGAGGGGGSGALNASTSSRYGGIGGGGGAYASRMVHVTEISGPVVINVGAGGLGGIGATVLGNGNAGTAGGASSFGAILSAPGGGAGAAGATNSNPASANQGYGQGGTGGGSNNSGTITAATPGSVIGAAAQSGGGVAGNSGSNPAVGGSSSELGRGGGGGGCFVSGNTGGSGRNGGAGGRAGGGGGGGAGTRYVSGYSGAGGNGGDGLVRLRWG